MPDANPFMQVYEGLWTLLNANPAFVTLVPVDNQIRYDGTDRNPEKRAIAPADLPEVRILMVAGGDLWLGRTSNGTSYTQRFEIQISTDGKPLASVFDIEWEVLRALANWQSVLTALTWGDDDFVKFCLVTEIASQTLDDEELNRDEYGWSAVFAGEVQMWFSTKALKP